MSKIEMYDPDYNPVDVFKALKKVNKGELLPEGGVFDFFYQHSSYPGVSFFLRHKSKTKFFYIDHDDFISEIKDQIPDWEISVDKNIVRILLLYKFNEAVVPMSFVFDLLKKEYKDLLIAVRKNKEIDLYLLNILYGGLVLESINKFKVPGEIVKALKSVK